MPKMLFSNAPTGSGKTYGTNTTACAQLNFNINSVVVQPTIRLGNQTIKDARTRFPDQKSRMRLIASKTGQTDSVAHRVTTYLANDHNGSLLYLTHAGFMRQDFWQNAKDWHVYVDEVMDISYFRTLKLKDHRDLMTNLFHTKPVDAKYSILEAEDNGRLREILASMKDDEVHEHFADVVWRLNHPDWTLYVENEHFEKFVKKEVHRLEIHGLLHPSFFDRFASTTLMGANLPDSFMFKYFKRCGVWFAENHDIIKRLRYTTHDNGERLLIKYLSNQRWSKNHRDTIIDEDENKSIGDIYLDLAKEESEKHSPDHQALWIANLDVHDEQFDGLRLPNNPLGLNDLTKYTACVVASALNPASSHVAFLQTMCGMTERQVRRALLSQTAYQALGRGNLRDTGSTGQFLVIVPDRDTADDIAACYPGSAIEQLVPPQPLPEKKAPGGQVKYETEDQRIEARKLQNRARTRRERWNGKHVRNEDYNVRANAPTPSHPNLAQNRTFWDGRAVPGRDENGKTIYHPFEDFEVQYYKHMIASGPLPEGTSFVAMLMKMARRQYAEKHHNQLFSPCAYDLTQDPTRGHSEKNIVEGTMHGVILDLDDTDLTVEEIRRAIPYQLLIYSTFSNSATQRRIRLYWETSLKATKEGAKALRMMAAMKLEAIGKKTGIDRSKFGPSALFYFPCQAKAGPEFSFCDLHDGPLIDPYEWLQACPNDIIDEIIARSKDPDLLEPEEVIVTGAEMRELDQFKRPEASHTAGNQERRIEGAIRRWQTYGCSQGPGRSMFYGLSMTLKDIGLDKAEIRRILDEQAVFAHNPAERRGEIDGLVKT